MVVTKSNELVLHVDVSPSEQVTDPRDSTVRSMIGLVSDMSGGLQGLREFKDTTSKNKAAKQAREGDRIVAALDNGDLSLHVVACLGHGSQWYRFGGELLSTLPDRVARRRTRGYVVDGQFIPLSTARAMGTYAAGLSFICLRASMWAQKLNVAKILVLMDKLPTKDVGDATKLLRVLQHHPDLHPAWKDMRESFGVEFNFGDDWAYNDPGEMPRPGKEHPNAILTDWVAQSTSAAANSKEWISGSKKRTEDLRRGVVGPFFALHKSKRLRVVSVDGLTISDAMKQAGEDSTPPQ